MRTYQYGDTVLITCLHETYDFDNDAWTAVNPDSGFPRLTIIDPDDLRQLSSIEVSSNASFTVGLTVTGGTSTAHGVVASKPGSTTLVLLDCCEETGSWESGEAITDTGTGSSTTASLLTGVAMTLAATGKHTYQHELPASSATGRWTGYVDVENGGYPNRQPFTFQVN